MALGYSYETFETLNWNWSGPKYKATFESRPFNQSASRYAFKGILNGKGAWNEEACVAKVFKKKYVGHVYKWHPDLSVSKKAFKFAKQFNSDCIPILNNYGDKMYKEIKVVVPFITKVKYLEGQSEIRECVEKYVAIEPFLDGNYTNFNSNIGYEDANYDLMLAFSHWTWSISDHNFMVCDLHGIENKRKFVLTDPAVHSLEQKYGISDLGEAGMQIVLSNHSCNSLCRRLGLETEEYKQLFPPENCKSTVYRFELPEKIRALDGTKRFLTILPA
ncbi:hypothetical protein ACJMK2_020949 [Sinanodonta woodiana]|uniref:Alpha-type protein kinase domain-containing protein n=1 Tax=Sinanodonta woodiana TaxID=1069815 RepID=A0ABD3U233_SINWO